MVIEKRTYYVVTRRYLRRTNALNSKVVVKYLRLPCAQGGFRTSWLADPTKATHFPTKELATQWGYTYGGEISHLSEPPL